MQQRSYGSDLLDSGKGDDILNWRRSDILALNNSATPGRM